MPRISRCPKCNIRLRDGVSGCWAKEGCGFKFPKGTTGVEAVLTEAEKKEEEEIQERRRKEHKKQYSEECLVCNKDIAKDEHDKNGGYCNFCFKKNRSSRLQQFFFLCLSIILVVFGFIGFGNYDFTKSTSFGPAPSLSPIMHLMVGIVGPLLCIAAGIGAFAMWAFPAISRAAEDDAKESGDVKNPNIKIITHCPNCGKKLGAGVSRCWSPGCNYVIPKGTTVGVVDLQDTEDKQ